MFIKVFQGLHQFRGQSAFTTWLTSIALNVGSSHLRSRLSQKNSQEAFEAQQYNTVSYFTPEEMKIEKERRQIVARGIQSLPPLYRQAVWLRYMNELSYREIVQELNVPLGTVKVWLYRGRHQLKKELEKSDIMPR